MKPTVQKRERKVEHYVDCGADAPVGIVVTDWFNLSLYKIAESTSLEHVDRHEKWGQRTCLSSRVQSQHQQPHLLIAEKLSWDNIGSTRRGVWRRNIPKVFEIFEPMVVNMRVRVEREVYKMKVRTDGGGVFGWWQRKRLKEASKEEGRGANPFSVIRPSIT